MLAVPMEIDILSAAGATVACAGATALAIKQAVKNAVAKTLAAAARYDTLTGLPNRCGLDEHFLQRLSHLKGGASLAVAILHVEGLDHANALEGPGRGDDVLIRAARLLDESVGANGFVARLDGAQFVTVIESTSDEYLIRRLQSLRIALEDLIGASALAGATCITVGAAVAPADGRNADELVRRALLALYWARDDAAERLAFYESAMDERLIERTTLDRDLGDAIASDAIEPYFQPIVALTSGQVQSYEILARWRHPKRGAVKAETFIPLAEQLGLIDALTFNLLRRACLEARHWPASTRLSVNFPPCLLSQPGVAFRVLSVLSAGGLAPMRLEIEITETGLTENLPQVRENLAVLRARGVRVALDDFGVGYSGLSRLQELPIDILKIDQRFVATLMDDAQTREIVGFVIRLARTLKIAIVAEGVEGPEQAAALKALGCDRGQGYFFAPPQEAQLVRLAHQLTEPIAVHGAQSGAA